VSLVIVCGPRLDSWVLYAFTRRHVCKRQREGRIPYVVDAQSQLGAALRKAAHMVAPISEKQMPEGLGDRGGGTLWGGPSYRPGKPGYKSLVLDKARVHPHAGTRRSSGKRRPKPLLRRVDKLGSRLDADGWGVTVTPCPAAEPVAPPRTRRL